MFVQVKRKNQSPNTIQTNKKKQKTKQFQNLHLKLPIVFKFKFTRSRINPKSIKLLYKLKRVFALQKENV